MAQKTKFGQISRFLATKGLQDAQIQVKFARKITSSIQRCVPKSPERLKNMESVNFDSFGNTIALCRHMTGAILKTFYAIRKPSRIKDKIDNRLINDEEQQQQHQ